MKNKFNKIISLDFEINLLLFKQFIIESKVFNFCFKVNRIKQIMIQNKLKYILINNYSK